MNTTNKLTLLLEHCKNPDIDDSQRRGYWSPPISPRKMRVEVADLAEAQQKFNDWIKRNGLGAGNLTRHCGDVMDGKILVGQFSYNGKLWVNGKQAAIEEPPAAPPAEEEVTGTVTVPKDLWSRLCSLAEGLAWSCEPLALMVDEARGVSKDVDKHYGQPTPGKFQRV